MNQNLAIDIDYGFKEDYVVLFEIYDQDPIEVNDKDGSWKKKDIEPFYRAATSKKGTFNEDGITIRADISEVWLFRCSIACKTHNWRRPPYFFQPK